jgi:glycosyltransferase involved in cell wall biosynthesis
MDKIKILFIGWYNIPHSYAIVNCFQLLSLYKNYKDKIEIYIQEYEYFNEKWNNVKCLIYGEEKNNVINSFNKWNGEKVDLVYSITYPYDISSPYPEINKEVPKCVFYTSEFSKLTVDYFIKDKMKFRNETNLINEIKNNDKLYFTSPSLWSSEGLRKWGVDDNKNRIITHGVDTGIFFKHKTDNKRNTIRAFYKIKETDILMINIGAMTQNKGIELILEALHILVNKQKLTQYKLLLKGSDDLYTSHQYIENYFEKMQMNNIIRKDELENLITNHIIFTNKTMSYSMINDFFNAADLYVSPYLAEGFNLTVLEALTAGLSVVVPKTGSTKEYINNIYRNGGEKFINFVNSQVGLHPNGLMQNVIEVDYLIWCLKNSNKNKTDLEYLTLQTFIIENYSWDSVSNLLYDYFKETTKLSN